MTRKSYELGTRTVRAWTVRSKDKSSAEEVLDRAGWARSVGGVSPYLTLFSRAGITREQADSDAAKLEDLRTAERSRLHLCSPRFGLRLGARRRARLHRRNKDSRQAGRHRKRNRQALRRRGRGARERLRSIPTGCARPPVKLVRNLGEEGKKKGLTTTLPVALEKAAGLRRHPPRSRQRPLRSAALSIRALASESSARVQAIAGASSNRTGAKIFWLDRAGIAGRVSDLFRARSESRQGRARTAETGAHRNRTRRPAIFSARRSRQI